LWESQFVDQAVFHRYRKELRRACTAMSNEIHKCDAEIYARALMGICHVVGRGWHCGMAPLRSKRAVAGRARIGGRA
jgi:hypothetical protein